jgi:L-alanine-DL-glutamate epimerase-like enolase superfamily enzyme
VATVTPHCPFFEYLPAHLAESAIRRELVADELVLSEGRLELPMRPGLGVEVDSESLLRFAEAARRLTAVGT